MPIRRGEPIHIWYADDDPDDHVLFQEALHEVACNAQLSSFENGMKLMQSLLNKEDGYPDIIFLDINMPLKDGKKCLQEIRDIPEMAHIPVIMFSTSVFEADVKETFEAGANLYISKPFFFADQVKILQQIFSQDWQTDLLVKDRTRFTTHA